MGFIQKPHSLIIFANIFVHFCLNSPKPKYEGHQSDQQYSTGWYLLTSIGEFGSDNSSIYQLTHQFMIVALLWLRLNGLFVAIALYCSPSWKLKVGNNIRNEELACSYLYWEFTCPTLKQPAGASRLLDDLVSFEKEPAWCFFPLDNQFWCCNHNLKTRNLNSTLPVLEWSRFRVNSKPIWSHLY